MAKNNSSKGSNSAKEGGRNSVDWDNIYDSINGGVATAGGVFCLINPSRPGCPGDPNRSPDTVIQNFGNQGSSVWIYVLLAIVLIVGLILLLRK